jgi:hypothetical protein
MKDRSAVDNCSNALMEAEGSSRQMHSKPRDNKFKANKASKAKRHNYYEHSRVKGNRAQLQADNAFSRMAPRIQAAYLASLMTTQVDAVDRTKYVLQISYACRRKIRTSSHGAHASIGHSNQGTVPMYAKVVSIDWRIR